MEKKSKTNSNSRLFLMTTMFVFLLAGLTISVAAEECEIDCVCGNGILEQGEGCDNGDANVDGQGPVWDFIQGQGDRDYCSTNCEVYHVPGTWCGDQEIQIPHEVCELNEDCSQGESCEGCQCVEVPCGNDDDCNDLDYPPCYEGVCNDEVCEQELTDSTGPSIFDLLINPFYNNGIFDIFATTTDECSNIEQSEYFVGHAGEPYCGEPGTGTPMNAFDGDFDELTEELIKENVNYLEDGLNWACVQSKDVIGNWGDCECVYFESDTIPPEILRNFKLNDVSDPHEYLICGNDPVVNVTICDTQSEIQGGEFFLDMWIPPEPIPAPWTGYWLEPLNHYIGSLGYHCSDTQGTIPLSDLEDGTHYLNQIRGKDIVENWGKVYNQNLNYSFIKDTTPPITEKEITFINDTYVECDYSEMMGEPITNGCYYTLPGAQIHLTSYDPDPQGTGEFAGDVTIFYRVWWSYDGSSWEVVQEGQSELNEGINFTLINDSYHLIEYWATDGCTWEEEHHFELDIVDTQPPESWKILQDPKVNCSVDDIALYGYEDCAYISKNTLVNLYCEDVEPHPVNGVTLYYKIDWKEYWGDSWDEGEWIPMEGSFEFNYQQDSFHRLTWYCEDALGNVESEHVELDIVDTEAPVTTKEVLGPKLPGYDDIHWFLTDESTVVFDCVDPEPHPVNDVTLNWNLWWRMTSDDQWELIDNGSNGGHKEFTNLSESYHKFEYWCVDALGNEEEHQFEIDAVDVSAPHTTKTVGEPNVLMDPECNPNEEICDYWVTQNTSITLDCQDIEPHPIGGETLYWREYLVDGTVGNWTVEEEAFVTFNFGEDCSHKLEWYCTDALGNSEGTEEEPILEYDNVDTAPPDTNKFVIKDGERIYSPAEGETVVGLQSGEDIKFCAEVNDVKLTGDTGVGVMMVQGRLIALDDPQFPLEWDEGEQAYCVERTAPESCGYWHYEVRAKDLLHNLGDWTDGILIIVDNVAPIGEVLNPHAGNSYYAGKVFPFYAPAVDFGGDSCTFDIFGGDCTGDDNCPASGVDYCDVYAIDYNFEGLNQSEIKQCWEDLWVYFDQVLADPYIEYIGRVPYENGVCTGYLEMAEDSNLSDTVFMAVDWVDKAGNSRFGLALNPWLSPITMNMEDRGDLTATPLFDPLVTSEDELPVEARIYDVSSTEQLTLKAVVEMYVGEDELIPITEDECTPEMDFFEGEAGCLLTPELPGYDAIDSGIYKYTVKYLIVNQVVETDTFFFVVDNDMPEMGVISPGEEEVYGELMPISLYLDDNSGIAEDSVKVKVTERGSISNGWCLFGDCAETDWINLNYFGNDLFTGAINFSEYEISESGEYNFEAYACDVLYDPCNDLDCNDGLGYLLDTRNLHHCVPVSDADFEPRPDCNDGIDNDRDGYIDYPSDEGCSSYEDESEVYDGGDPVCGDGITEGEEECEFTHECGQDQVCFECQCSYDDIS